MWKSAIKIGFSRMILRLINLYTGFRRFAVMELDGSGELDIEQAHG
jgi:hypothetical protein